MPDSQMDFFANIYAYLASVEGEFQHQRQKQQAKPDRCPCCRGTSPEIASDAGKELRDKNSTQRHRSQAASNLAQRRWGMCLTCKLNKAAARAKKASKRKHLS